MKNILVIGGGGYVGIELVKELLNKNFKVKILDIFIYGQNFLPEDKNLIKIIGDIRNTDILESSLKDIDEVIHLACISNDPSFELNPILGKSINLDSFEPFVKKCIKARVKKIIYASSSSVYGLSDKKDVTEEHKTLPLTDYSKFKLECENILHKYKKEIDWTIIRPSTVCGYSDRQRFDLVVNILTNFAYNKNEIQIFGGDQLRPNIHIKDMIKSYLTILNAKRDLINHQVFNVGFENKSLNELAKIVKKEFDSNLIIKKVKSDDLRSYHVSSEKIVKVLGFKCEYNISDAVKDLIISFKNKKFTNPLTNENYFNIKKMQSINLK
jgi:nucleoside-diphosphate-sugar epimerase